MNMNTLAKDVSAKEGLKEPISIAQIKEVIRCIVDVVIEKPEYLSILCKYALRRLKAGK